MREGYSDWRESRYRWLTPLILMGLTAAVWLAWYGIDPRMAAIRYIASGSPLRSYTLGVPTLELFAHLHGSLRMVGWISLAGSALSGLVAWLWPRRLGMAAVFTASAMIYALSASLVIQGQSSAPHYVYLAEAFTQGQTTLEGRPPHAEENDWTYYQGKWMVSFPPGPAVLMTPLVAYWGLEFNDVIFTLLLGALNVAIFYETMGRVGGHLRGPPRAFRGAQIGLTVAFGFGTVHWWLSTNGQVWFTAQIAATTFTLLAIAETFGRGRAWVVGTWLAAAALCRPTVLLSLPAFAWLLSPRNPGRKLAWGLVPLGVAGIAMAGYNYARFGNPLELGYAYMQLEGLLAERMAENGSFSLAYLRDNLYHAFLNLPEWRDRWPFVVMDGWGLSLLVSTPVLIFALLAPWRQRVAQAMGLAALLVAVPDLLYYNTGYLQAGYRYALDFLPFLFVLVAYGVHGRRAIWRRMLIGASVAMGFLMMVNFVALSMGAL